VEHHVEALRLDTQLLADLLLALVSKIEAEQELPVAFEAKPGQDLLYPPRPLLGNGPVVRKRRWGELGKDHVFVRRKRAVSRLLAAVSDEQPVRRAVYEPGDSFRLPQLAAADLREDYDKGFLVQVLGEMRVPGESKELLKEAAAEARHELGLGRPVAGPDASDQLTCRSGSVAARCWVRSHGSSTNR
jgi:hypothetical protein